tara:strand:+ start:185 stop:415 length:231 start_codon:yes stop_codon:yes gene_type:complete
MIKFNTLFFLIGFTLGIIYIYATNPDKKVVVKHPTPQNAGKIVYRDKVNNCYKYRAEEVQCPEDPNEMLDHPLVID